MAQRTTTPTGPMSVIGYIRVSTEEQADSGAGLAAQRAAIEAECARNNWTLLAVHEDGGMSGSTLNRPAMQQVLRLLAAGEAGALIVATSARLSRDVRDLLNLLDQSAREGWKLVMLDMGTGMDLMTPTGRLMATVVAGFNEYERLEIGRRTKVALAARKAAGVQLGRPRLLDPELAADIRAQRAAGMTLQGIADRLNSAGTLTPTGRQWTPTLVRKITLQAA